jgi:hypothetical protein
LSRSGYRASDLVPWPGVPVPRRKCHIRYLALSGCSWVFFRSFTLSEHKFDFLEQPLLTPSRKSELAAKPYCLL